MPTQSHCHSDAFRFRRRRRTLLVLLALAWFGLAGRMIQLQWIDRREFAELANRQRVFYETVPARPGEILDRHGRLLATTISTRSLYIVPDRISHPSQIVRRISETLALDADRLLKQILRNRNKKFLWVKRRLEDNQTERIRRLELPAETWGFRMEYLRRYPQGLLAAHVLGLRDIDGNGRGGLEEKYDRLLGGSDGRRLLIRDARGRVMDVRDNTIAAARHGRTIVLSLDAVIQLDVERELDRLMRTWKPHSACAIVLDPRNGEILATASRPTFDPNHPVNVPDAAWTNTTISAVYEPGSTIKPFIVAWAIDRGLLKSQETFNCQQGAYQMGRRVLHDHHPYGELSVTDILVKSSNIGMAKIGERLTNAGLYEAVVAFGFGRRTGSGLPGELAGRVRALKEWDSYSTGSIPMGQEIAVTPLQLIAAHAALANGGKLISPQLVLQGDAGPSGDTADSSPRMSKVVVSQTVTPKTARWLVEGPMRDVVRRGTGTEAQLKDYDVFGKTGTAQKIDPATGKYSSKRYVSSFICGAPTNDPRVLVLVQVDEPSAGGNHFGGTVAAPAAARILQKTLILLRVPAKNGPIRAARRL